MDILGCTIIWMVIFVGLNFSEESGEKLRFKLIIHCLSMFIFQYIMYIK